MARLIRPDQVEIDDDPARVDPAAVHRFPAEESYWAAGRDRATVERLVREATRVVGPTTLAHTFYAKLGFGAPSERILERPRIPGPHSADGGDAGSAELGGSGP